MIGITKPKVKRNSDAPAMTASVAVSIRTMSEITRRRML